MVSCENVVFLVRGMYLTDVLLYMVTSPAKDMEILEQRPVNNLHIWAQAQLKQPHLGYQKKPTSAGNLFICGAFALHCF